MLASLGAAKAEVGKSSPLTVKMLLNCTNNLSLLLAAQILAITFIMKTHFL